MKLNKDNYELVMFDLLEGNLSETDELLVMEQIEGDEFLFREWKLFKATVLIAEKEVVYKGKDSLIRKEEADVVPLFGRWTAVAASVCILAAAFFFWPKSELASLANINTIEETPKLDKLEYEEHIALAADTNEGIIDVKSILHSDVQDAKKSIVIALKQSNTNKFEAQNEVDNRMPIAKKVKPKMELIVQDLKQDEATQGDIVKNYKANDTENSVINNKNTLEMQENKPAAKPSTSSNTKKVLAYVTKNSPSRMRDKAAGIIALVSNPKIKIKPDFKNKKPSLQIELETKGYQAIASIEPFKNRN